MALVKNESSQEEKEKKRKNNEKKEERKKRQRKREIGFYIFLEKQPSTFNNDFNTDEKNDEDFDAVALTEVELLAD